VSLLSLLLLSSVAMAPGPGDSVRFSVEPAVVTVGDTVTLTWDAPGATSVFVSQVGLAPAAGTARVVPGRAEVTYVLSAEFPDGLEVRSFTVRVNGARGDGPDVTEMVFPYSTRCAPLSRSVNRVVERVNGFFQDSLLVEAQERTGPLREVILETRVGSQRVVPAAPERRIRARRVFYRVRVGRGAGEEQVVCSVSSNVQFQRAGESTWYAEPRDSELHALAARYLMQRIRNE
jgi:hypothetical protein